ncbi:hypothetical protein EMCRGX_G000639 [Ephydatia muelleri]
MNSYNITMPPITVTGLAPRTTYSFSVVGYTLRESGLPQEIQTATAAIPKVPGLVVSGTSTTSVRVSWLSIQLPSDGTLTGYTLHYRYLRNTSADVRFGWSRSHTFPPVTTSGDITDLTPNGVHHISVVAEVAISAELHRGDSDASLAVNPFFTSCSPGKLWTPGWDLNHHLQLLLAKAVVSSMSTTYTTTIACKESLSMPGKEPDEERKRKHAGIHHTGHGHESKVLQRLYTSHKPERPELTHVEEGLSLILHGCVVPAAEVCISTRAAPAFKPRFNLERLSNDQKYYFFTKNLFHHNALDRVPNRMMSTHHFQVAGYRVSRPAMPSDLFSSGYGHVVSSRARSIVGWPVPAYNWHIEKLQCFAGNPGQLGRLESLPAQRVTVSCWPPKPHLQGGVSWPVLPQEDDGPPLGSSSSLSPCQTQQPLHISPRMVAIIRALMERCRFSFPTPHTYGGTSSQHRCVGHPGGVALGLACAGFKSSGTYAPHHCPAQSKRRADNNQLKGRPLNCCHNEVISLGELVTPLTHPAPSPVAIHVEVHLLHGQLLQNEQQQLIGVTSVGQVVGKGLWRWHNISSAPSQCVQFSAHSTDPLSFLKSKTPPVGQVFDARLRSSVEVSCSDEEELFNKNVSPKKAVSKQITKRIFFPERFLLT